MAIESTGPIRLRGAAGDGRTDINEEINGNATDTDVSLGTLNTTAFTNVSDGNTTTGRSMSEMRNYSATPAFYPTTESAGALGESLTFESSQNQKVERQISIPGSGTTATISVWLKRHESYSGRELIYFSTDVTGGNNWIYGLEFENDYLLIFPQIIYNTATTSYTKSNFKFNDFGSWYHIVLAMDTTKAAEIDRLKVYVNGDELNIDDFEYFNVPPQNTARISQANHYQALGDRWLQGSRNCNSTIGDIKYIDGQQLRPDSFGQMKNGVWVPKAFNTASTDVLVSSNLEVNYQFEGNANDSANSYNGTVNGATFINNNYGSIDFDGNNDYINFTNPISTASDTSYSFSTWINFDSVLTSGYYAIIERTSSTAIPGFLSYFYGNSTGLAMSAERYYGGVQKYANNYNTGVIYPFEENKWYNITASYDSSTSKVKWYINGYEYGELTLVVKSTGRSHASGGRIGADYNGGNSINGQMGELQIYSSALTATEALQNYNATKHKYTYGLNGFHLPLNNTSTGTIVSDSSLKVHLDASDTNSYTGSGSSWLDLSGNSATATLNGVNFLSTTNGGVFDFDGSNDDATIDDTKINYSNFSLEFWLNPDGSLSSSNTIFSRYSTTSSQNVWHIRGNDTNNGIEFVRYTGGGGTLLKDSTVVPVNKWTHVFITHDETNGKLKIYKNGNLDAEHSISSTLPTGSTVDLLVGNLQGYSFRYNGQMAQIRFYNDILTAQEVIQNYRATQGNYEQVSTVDISGNANSHTPTALDYTYHRADSPDNNGVTFDYNNFWGTGSPTLEYGNKIYKSSSTAEGFVTTTMSLPRNSGKYYFEFKSLAGTGHGGFGITDSTKFAPANSTSANPLDAPEGFYISTRSDNYADIFNDTGLIQADAFPMANSGGVVAFAIDTDNDKYWTGYASGGSTTWWNSGDPVAGTNESDSGLDYDHYMPFVSNWSSGSGRYTNAQLLCDEDEIVGAAPQGYKLLKLSSLPNAQFDPKDLEQNKDYFKAVKYVGDGADGPIAGPWYITCGDAGNYKTKFTGRFTQTDCQYTPPAGFSYWGGSWDPNNVQGTLTFTNSNKTVEEPNSGFYVQTATTNSYSSGKYYMEVVMNQIEVVLSFNNDPSETPFTTAFHANTLQFRNWSGVYDFSNTQVSSTTFAVNDVIGVAANIDDGEFSFYKNNTLVFTNTFGPGKKITAGFKPDLIWIKNRSAGWQHQLFDSVRGFGSGKDLTPSENYVEGQYSSQYGYVASTASDGFTLAKGSSVPYLVNNPGENFIAWCWKAAGFANDFNVIENGTLTTSNSNTTAGITAGTLTTNWAVSANRDTGFSIIRFTTAASGNYTLGHGLSKAPEFILYKRTATTSNWIVYHTGLGTNQFTFLNTDAAGTAESGVWSTPTSTTIPLNGGKNVSGPSAYIGYAWHSVDGFSKFGTYIGNASTNGPFVYTGFKPAFIMTKSTSTGFWVIKDNARDTKNPVVKRLRANDGGYYESSDGADIDFLSNGFKISTASNEVNAAQTYIYMAFAEDPFTTSNSVATFGDGNEFVEDGNYPEDNFSTTLYTGNGGTQKVKSGLKADLIWIKDRAANNPVLMDTVRGFDQDGVSSANSYIPLHPNTDSPQTNFNSTWHNNYGYLTSIESDGFTVVDGPNNAADNFNRSTYNYVAWSWKAAGVENTYNILENGITTSSASASTLGLNTGTITPSGVSANKDNGFSIVKYTGNGTVGAKIPHGLNSAPEFTVIKKLDTTGYTGGYWCVGYGSYDKDLYLNTNATPGTINYFWNAAPTATVIELKNDWFVNYNTAPYIMYNWHSVPGFSKIGTYTGKGSTAPLNIHLGFEPGWVMIRRTDSGNSWPIFDNKRDSSTSNLSQVLWADLIDQENNGGTTTSINLTKDGFNFTTSNYGGSINVNGGTYIYIAFAHR